MCTIRIIACVYTHHIVMHPLHIRGIGPWKVGQLAASLYLWDIVWKQCAPTHREDWIIKGLPLTSIRVHVCINCYTSVYGRVYSDTYTYIHERHA